MNSREYFLLRQELVRKACRGTLLQSDLHQYYKKLVGALAGNLAMVESEYVQFLQCLVFCIVKNDDSLSMINSKLFVIFSERENLFLLHVKNDRGVYPAEIWLEEASGMSVFHALAKAGNQFAFSYLEASAGKVIKPEHLKSLMRKKDAQGKTVLEYARESGIEYDAAFEEIPRLLPQKRSCQSPLEEKTVPEANGDSLSESDAVVPSRKRKILRRSTLFYFEQDDNGYSSTDSSAGYTHLRERGSQFQAEPVVILFRGITFLQTDYVQEQKRLLKRMNRTSQALLSPGAMYLADHALFSDPAEEIRCRWRNMASKKRDAMLDHYIKNAAAYDELQRVEAGKPESEWFSDAITPAREILSFDLSASTAAAYALCLEAGSSKRVANRQYPGFDENGRPHHRLAGVVLAVMQPVASWDETVHYYARRLWAENRIHPGYFISLGNEVIVVGGLGRNQMLFEFPLLVPDFSKSWRPEYLTGYGLSESVFNDYVSQFKRFRADRNSLRRQQLEKSILLHLKKYYGKRIENQVSELVVSGYRCYPGLREGDFRSESVKYKDAEAERSACRHAIHGAQTTLFEKREDSEEAQARQQRQFNEAIKLLMNDDLQGARDLLSSLKVESGCQDIHTAYEKVLELLAHSQQSGAMAVQQELDSQPDGIDSGWLERVTRFSESISEWFHNGDYSKVTRASVSFLNESDFITRFKKIFACTQVDHAKDVIRAMRSIEKILLDYASSQVNLHFVQPDVFLLNCESLSSCKHLFDTLERWLCLRDEGEQWILALECSPVDGENGSWRILESQNQCRLELGTFSEKKEKFHRHMSACFDRLWDAINALIGQCESSPDLLMSLEEEQVDVFSGLILQFLPFFERYCSQDDFCLKSFHDMNVLELMADALVDRLEFEGEAALSPRKEYAIRQLIVHIYEEVFNRESSKVELVSLPSGRERRVELLSALLGQYADMMVLSRTLGNLHFLQDHYEAVKRIEKKLTKESLTDSEASEAALYLKNVKKCLDEEGNPHRRGPDSLEVTMAPARTMSR